MPGCDGTFDASGHDPHTSNHTYSLEPIDRFCLMKKYIQSLKYDLPASIVVFLVALPLCLGIALASGVPLFAGLLSGIIGGIVVGLLSKSSLSVSGPAAGLVVIVLNAVDTLGTFEAFLLAVFFAGLIQLTLGFLKAGVIGLYFPSSVIKGMLAAIGLILIMKQIPHLIGFDGDPFGEMDLLQQDGATTFSFLFEAFSNIVPGSLIVGAFTLGLLILWERPFIKSHTVLQRIPGSVLAVLAAVGINALFAAYFPNLYIEASHLVSIPVLSGDESVVSLLRFPDFSAILSLDVYITAITLAIVASLETLLSVEAVDKLDPLKRRTPQNAELKAQGVGNMLCGLLGGLPITAVIVRSSANLNSGARTKMSAIMHGIMLVAAVLMFPAIMNMIPLAALAAILIVVGFKLTRPALYRQQYALGRSQFVPFIITIVSILFTDLLIGILVGMSVGIFYILRANYKVPYYFDSQPGGANGKSTIHIKLSEHVSFLNKANLQTTLDHIPENSKVILDGSMSKQIDIDALEVIYNFEQTAAGRNIQLLLKEIPAMNFQGTAH